LNIKKYHGTDSKFCIACTNLKLALKKFAVIGIREGTTLQQNFTEEG
jgi:hypothetical protein